LLFADAAIDGSPDREPMRCALVEQPTTSTAASNTGVSLRTVALIELAESCSRVAV
jgi:hypothetical protein